MDRAAVLKAFGIGEGPFAVEPTGRPENRNVPMIGIRQDGHLPLMIDIGHATKLAQSLRAVRDVETAARFERAVEIARSV